MSTLSNHIIDTVAISTRYWKSLQAVITPNGYMWTCTNKMEHADAVLGDLSAESFADIWARAGSPCGTDSGCRVACRGDLANQTLNEVMTLTPHANFV